MITCMHFRVATEESGSLSKAGKAIPAGSQPGRPVVGANGEVTAHGVCLQFFEAASQVGTPAAE
jgi:hypothetical protein